MYQPELSVYIFSLNPHRTFTRQLTSLSPFYRGGNWDSREIQQHSQGHTANSMGARIQAQVFLTLLCFVCAFI